MRKRSDNPERTPTALVFDFDGTIADTLGEAFLIYNDIALEHGYLPVAPEQVEELRSLHTRDLLKHLGISKRKIPILVATALSRLKKRMPEMSLIAGMADVLPQLRERVQHFAILSSNAPENVEAFLDVQGIRSLFTSIKGTGKLSGKSKHLRSFTRTHSLDPAEILYIGDEIRDLRAAHKAGIDAVAVTWGLNSEASLAQENPRYLLRSPKNC